MNTNTSGALLVGILAAAGLMWSSPLTVWFCLATCASAFLADDMGSVFGARVRLPLVLLSWAAVASAAISLAI